MTVAGIRVVKADNAWGNGTVESIPIVHWDRVSRPVSATSCCEVGRILSHLNPSVSLC